MFGNRRPAFAKAPTGALLKIELKVPSGNDTCGVTFH